MMAMIKNVIAQLNMVILLTALFRDIACSGASRLNPFVQSENPALFTWHLIQWLRLVDIDHAHGRVVILDTAADSAEVTLGSVLHGNQRCFRLLAVFPAQVLLASDQGDQQRKYAKQSLLQMQWRDAYLSGALASHPGFLTLIRLGQF
jgi:hypothetical protein